MVGQDQTENNSTGTRVSTSNKNGREGAIYVLDMLSELQTVAELSGLKKISGEIEDILSRHSADQY